jgi:8-oxo-dGTP diphosphatase
MIINAADCIISYKGGIVLIDRMKEPLGLAIPGGKLEGEETLEQTVVREMREEVGLELANLRQFRTYSEPNRDPRFRVISTVFTADGFGELRAASDAKRAQIISLDSIGALRDRFAFDHYQILRDYQDSLRK